MILQLKTRELIWLTSGLLYELISLAKTKGGCIVEVKKEADMRGVAAYIFHEGDIDFVGRTTRCDTISLSDPIDVDNFRAEVRPEMDFGEILRDQIYRFVVHHEIGHVLLDPKSKIMWNTNGIVNEDKTQMLRFACELRADRYAWKSLFHLQPLPRKKGCESMVESLEAFMKDHKDLFTGPRVPKPLPG